MLRERIELRKTCAEKEGTCAEREDRAKEDLC